MVPQTGQTTTGTRKVGVRSMGPGGQHRGDPGRYGRRQHPTPPPDVPHLARQGGSHKGEGAGADGPAARPDVLLPGASTRPGSREYLASGPQVLHDLEDAGHAGMAKTPGRPDPLLRPVHTWPSGTKEYDGSNKPTPGPLGGETLHPWGARQARGHGQCRAEQVPRTDAEGAGRGNIGNLPGDGAGECTDRDGSPGDPPSTDEEEAGRQEPGETHPRGQIQSQGRGPAGHAIPVEDRGNSSPPGTGHSLRGRPSGRQKPDRAGSTQADPGPGDDAPPNGL